MPRAKTTCGGLGATKVLSSLTHYPLLSNWSSKNLKDLKVTERKGSQSSGLSTKSKGHLRGQPHCDRGHAADDGDVVLGSGHDRLPLVHCGTPACARRRRPAGVGMLRKELPHSVEELRAILSHYLLFAIWCPVRNILKTFWNTTRFRDETTRQNKQAFKTNKNRP